MPEPALDLPTLDIRFTSSPVRAPHALTRALQLFSDNLRVLPGSSIDPLLDNRPPSREG
jgi:hypothetical protein